MNERAALWNEILRKPKDDTLRLAFADFLDENGDTADHDRAELIRVQYELAKCRVCPATIYHPAFDAPDYGGKRYIVPSPMEGKKPCGWCPVCKVVERERQLLAANPSWNRCPCPRCGGDGHNHEPLLRIREGYVCPTCGGAGDLFQVFPNPPTGKRAWSRVLDWHAGWPRSLACALAEATGAWGREVVKAVPLTRLVPTDRRPEQEMYVPTDFEPSIRSGEFYWRTIPYHPTSVPTHDIPPAVFDTLEGGVVVPGEEHLRFYATRDAAVNALTIALCILARTS